MGAALSRPAGPGRSADGGRAAPAARGPRPGEALLETNRRRKDGMKDGKAPFVGRLVLACGVALASRGAPAPAQRAPVLKQVTVPHAYYWREMYVPQATSGPGAVTWSPDGADLIYTMQGSLWRQLIGARAAVQLTGEEGYDYQPD